MIRIPNCMPFRKLQDFTSKAITWCLFTISLFMFKYYLGLQPQAFNCLIFNYILPKTSSLTLIQLEMLTFFVCQNVDTILFDKQWYIKGFMFSCFQQSSFLPLSIRFLIIRFFSTFSLCYKIEVKTHQPSILHRSRHCQNCSELSKC